MIGEIIKNEENKNEYKILEQIRTSRFSNIFKVIEKSTATT